MGSDQGIEGSFSDMGVSKPGSRRSSMKQIQAPAFDTGSDNFPALAIGDRVIGSGVVILAYAANDLVADFTMSVSKPFCFVNTKKSDVTIVKHMVTSLGGVTAFSVDDLDHAQAFVDANADRGCADLQLKIYPETLLHPRFLSKPMRLKMMKEQNVEYSKSICQNLHEESCSTGFEIKDQRLHDCVWHSDEHVCSVDVSKGVNAEPGSRRNFYAGEDGTSTPLYEQCKNIWPLASENCAYEIENEMYKYHADTSYLQNGETCQQKGLVECIKHNLECVLDLWDPVNGYPQLNSPNFACSPNQYYVDDYLSLIHI